MKLYLSYIAVTLSNVIYGEYVPKLNSSHTNTPTNKKKGKRKIKLSIGQDQQLFIFLLNEKILNDFIGSLTEFHSFGPGNLMLKIP